ncbi:sporulation associated protein [Colletotrichum tofieldiae]|nr:sporulation associated protein [Colletotrichum tofieldiae]GKT90232.1 sporulation associated protein [Colletotrichum tofieldiae]
MESDFSDSDDPTYPTRQAKDAGNGPRNLVLCFDGTGNSFSGTDADTNVVKLLRLLNRNHASQLHYYQSGIGTHDFDSNTSLRRNLWGQVKDRLSRILDSGIGSTFDAHVIAGYKFLMRHYEIGDKIYMFGFSRGAYIAKFLARMVHTAGLLCKGNDELVAVVFRRYTQYLTSQTCVFQNTPLKTGSYDATESSPRLKRFRKERDEAKEALEAFSETFCWSAMKNIYGGNQKEHVNIKVHFLGLWDCVNSVAVLEQQPFVGVAVTGTAYYVRHAVAVDERRVKFKPSLFDQEENIEENDDLPENVKEVWFPGNHGDVGGGWDPVKQRVPDEIKNMTLWQRIMRCWSSTKGYKEESLPSWISQGVSYNLPKKCQMSDISLDWMIHELKLVDEATKCFSEKLSWSKGLRRFRRQLKDPRSIKDVCSAPIHDILRFGYGASFVTVLFWNFFVCV